MEMVLQQQQQRCRAGPATAPHRKKPEDEEEELRRGPWTVDEDLTLINYVAEHGDGRWNALARAAGLKRTGKSCRLRWLNYLRPDVKRGDFTADEQMLILDLHSRWGNRWSKIAQQLPGRTDNEIKNYWRTRVQKHARRLGCDVDSRRFKDAIAYLWMPPRLASRRSSSSSSSQQKQSTKSSSSSSPRLSSALTTTATPAGLLPPDDDDDDNNNNNRSPGPSSSDSSLTSAEIKSVPHGTDWIQQVADHHESFWFTAPALDNGGQFQDDLTGWVQGFSDHTLWSLDDLWRMQ